MPRDIRRNDHLLGPGHVILPANPVELACVVSSGVAVTLFDCQRRRGGMGHYFRPYRIEGLSTPVFAAPAIVALVRMLLDSGSKTRDLEAHLIGGAVQESAQGYEPGLSEKNISVGIEVIRKLDVRLAGQDTGGERARKVVFKSGSGELIIAHVEQVRASDWYPDLPRI